MSKIKVAFLGTGGISAKHARVYVSHPDTQIVGGCDVTTDQVNGLWKRVYPEGTDPATYPPAFTDAAQMYAKAKPDAVVICTPHTLHYEHGMQALDHGCHVLMEKPMVTSAAHAYTLAEKVKKSGKVLIVGYNTPCSPELAYIRDAIQTKRLGELELISGFLVQGWMKATAGSWRHDPALSGGGQAYDSGAHLMATLCWTVNNPIAEVFAFVDNKGTRVDINSSINIRFENGVMASIAVGGNCPSSGAYLTYAFTNGRINVDGWNATWMEVYEGREKVKYPLVPGKQLQPADNFIDAILRRDTPRTSPENGIIHSELMDTIYESARTGKPARPKRS